MKSFKEISKELPLSVNTSNWQVVKESKVLIIVGHQSGNNIVLPSQLLEIKEKGLTFWYCVSSHLRITHNSHFDILGSATYEQIRQAEKAPYFYKEFVSIMNAENTHESSAIHALIELQYNY